MNLCKRWEVQPCFQVRSAGFPAHWLTGFDSSSEVTLEAKVRVERDHLAKVLSNLRLQEAIGWQNPRMASNFLFPFLARYPHPENSKVRRIQRKLLLYIQRYCSKNEAIGYFGPIGWGHLRPELTAPSEAKDSWLLNRTIYFEPWLFHHLWETYPEDVQANVPLALDPKIRIEGQTLLGDRRCRDRRGQIKLSSSEADCLRTLGASAPEEAVELKKCRNKSWLVRSPAIPASPQLLEHYGDKQTQHFSADTLGFLNRSKRELESCRGNPQKLVSTSLTFLEQLKPLTRGRSERGQGKFYEGRLPFYEDCQRRSLDLPSDWITGLREPLRLILDSARWLCFRAGKRFGGELHRLCRELKATRGDGFCATHLWERVERSWSDIDLTSIASELTEKFESVFGTASHPTELSCEEVSQQWRELFDVPTSGAPLARFHSVDLFLSKEHDPILGEVHPALYPFNDISTNFQHPDRQILQEWYSGRASSNELWPCQLLPFSRLAHDGWANPEAFHLLTRAQWGSWRPSDRQLRLGDFAVYAKNNSFEVRHRDRELAYSLLEFLQDDLIHQLHTLYKPFAKTARRGRVKLGPLVIARKGWGLDPELIETLMALPSSERFRVWNEKFDDMGVPNTFYAQFEQEIKPIFLRRDSLLFTDLFFSLLRPGKKCRVEEALPEPSEGWITNPEGKACGEFRFALFDRSEYREELLN